MTFDLHKSTFDYMKPTDHQVEEMAYLRKQFADFAETLSNCLPAGPDKTYILRKIRECAMWSNVAITRNADGSPRT